MKLLTVNEMCFIYNISRSTLYRLINEGMPYEQVRKHKRFNKDVVDKWMKERNEDEQL